MNYKSNLPKRILANILDYSLIILVAIVYLMYFGEEPTSGHYVIEGFQNVIILPIVWFFYFIVAEGVWQGTWGFHALNLIVVKENGQPIAGKEAFVRRMFDLIDFWLFFGVPALITMNITEKNQRLGDVCAGTVVIDLADEAQYASIY